MKNSTMTTLLLAFFTPLFLAAQGWEKTYDGGHDEIVAAADPTLDGGIAMAGNQRDDDNDIEYAFIYKTDADGILQWEFYDSLHVSDWVRVHDILCTSDGNYLMSIFGNERFVEKIAPDGTILWEYEFTSTPYLDIVTDITQAADGGYLLFGYFDAPSPGNGNRIGFVKLDNDGNFVWEIGFPNIDLPMWSGEVIETANEDILISGYIGYYGDSQNSFVKRLDSGGNIIWESEYDETEDVFGLELVELSSGDFVIGGMIAPDLSTLYATLRKIDANGNQMWYQTYTSLGHQQLGGLQQSSDGGFVLAGHTETFSPNWDDFYLMKVDALGNEQWIKNYGRSKDEYLAEILLSPDGEYFLVGQTENLDDSYDAYLVKTDSLGNSFTNELNGNVFHDENLDCLLDLNEMGLEYWMIEARKGDDQYFELSDPLGNYSFSLDTGTYEITVFPISPYWDVCDTSFNVSFAGFFETVTEDIPAQVEISCPLLDISIGTPFLRRCFESTYSVHYCNYGTITAEDSHVEIILDPFMEFINSSIPLESQIGDTLTFLLGDVEIGDCGDFIFNIVLEEPGLPCDSIPLGQTHCVEANIYPDSICLPDNNWSGASIEVDAVCQEDSISFYIQNVGDAPTQSNLQYFVIEDDVILYEGTFSLDEGGTEIITVLTDGSTFRLEAEQEPNHPGMSMPSVSVEGCGDENLIFTFGFVNIFAQDDGDPFVDIDCRQNIGAFDPNDKMGFPLGYGDENYITRGQDIEYLVRFQNTGTDTAFNVVIRDELSDFLDISTIRPGAASHPYDFDISPGGELVFNFNNIMLPDSNVNEAASHGFVEFKVAQKPNLDLETKIYNFAGIYFDFNAPVITNETLHTIGESIFTVSIDPVLIPSTNVNVFPNPFTNFANIEIEGLDIEKGEFKLYDVAGRLLRREQFNSNNFTIHKKDLQAGMYFFTIENAGQLITSGKIVAQ